MELRHLRVFEVLADELHFGRAALRLRVAQSAVSTTLKSLEEEVGVPLLRRTRRSVSLTLAGSRFREHATRSLAEAEAATEAARRAMSGETGRLDVRFTVLSTLTVVPKTIARFIQRYPNVRVTLEASPTIDQIEAIRAGRCDIGFISPHHEVAPLTKEVLVTSPLVVVMNRQHSLAKRKRLALGDLARERFVFLQESSEPHVVAMFRRACEKAGFSPNIVLEIGQVDALLAFVEAGVGIACVPAFVSQSQRRDLRAVPLTAPPRGGISVVWSPDTLSPPASRFLALLRDTNQRV